MGFTNLGHCFIYGLTRFLTNLEITIEDDDVFVEGRTIEEAVEIF